MHVIEVSRFGGPEVLRPAELEALVTAVAKGTLRTRVDRTLPLVEAAEAHRLNEDGGLRGKVVLLP